MAKLTKVTLDAGHYGRFYNQSNVVKAYYESKFNWKITNYMKYFFEERGIKVKLTRNDIEKDLDLFSRGFKSTNSDLFISNHSNACDNPDVDYPVVIRGFDQPLTDELASLLANKIAEIMGTNQKGRTWTRIKNNSYDEWYGVLRGSRHAGTRYRFIIEHGFHTNKNCAIFLLADDNIKKLAKAEVDIICNYFNVKDDNSKFNKYVRVKVNNLNIREIPDFNAKPVMLANKGEVFTIIDEVETKQGTNMYKLKSGLYVTTSKKYVELID